MMSVVSKRENDSFFFGLISYDKGHYVTVTNTNAEPVTDWVVKIYSTDYITLFTASASASLEDHRADGYYLLKGKNSTATIQGNGKVMIRLEKYTPGLLGVKIPSMEDPNITKVELIEAKFK